MLEFDPNLPKSRDINAGGLPPILHAWPAWLDGHEKPTVAPSALAAHFARFALARTALPHASPPGVSP